MIPKIIHYCWLSDSPMSEKAQKCMESWKKYLPDYEFIHWDFSKFPKGKSVWVDQAFNSGKYAFAADYIRLFALYNYGGIYLDTDVEVLKPYDDLLDLPYFIGQEKTPSGIEAATLGFQPGHPLLKRILERYENRAFIKENGKMDLEPLPYIIRKCISAEYEYRVINKKSEFIYSPSVINVFAANFFSPKRSVPFELTVTEDTYSIHHFAAAWVPKRTNSKSGIKIRLRKKIKELCLFQKDVVMLSNTDFDNEFSRSFGIKELGPLSKARVRPEDIVFLYKHIDLFEKDNLRFIKDKESNMFSGKDLNYPIAIINNSEVEIHFIDCYSREQALEIWNNGVENMDHRKPIFVENNRMEERMDYYKVCLSINFNRDYICIN